MRILILFASPRPEGNTMDLVRPFMDECGNAGHTCEILSLYRMEIAGCTGCRFCQEYWDGFHCRIHDDMDQIAAKILAADLIVFATPVYSWYCTAPMKAMMDRLIYGLCKYYGEEKGPSLMAGKSVATITTCGYRPECGADLWEEGLKRYCHHAQLEYAGMLSERFLGYKTVFMDEEKERHARAFAKELCGESGA